MESANYRGSRPSRVVPCRAKPPGRRSRTRGSYTWRRRPEPEFAAAIRDALCDARILVNVGGGGGSYEPTDLDVTPVEPSATMRVPAPHWSTPAINATAEDLRFGDGIFDAALASFVVHQWRDLSAGLHEVRRVTRGPVVIFTSDPGRAPRRAPRKNLRHCRSLSV